MASCGCFKCSHISLNFRMALTVFESIYDLYSCRLFSKDSYGFPIVFEWFPYELTMVVEGVPMVYLII